LWQCGSEKNKIQILAPAGVKTTSQKSKKSACSFCRFGNIA